MTEADPRWAVPPPERPAIPVSDGSLFPVRRIWCVGRNYADHAREMGHDPAREPPFFFAKPADAIVPDGACLSFPRATADLHHEVELALAIGRAGADLTVEQAEAAILGYALALDMTRRDLQAEAKKAARPWDLAKGFDLSCPIGAIRPVAEIGHLRRGAIRLEVNGELRQSGDLGDMIWTPAECVAALSRLVDLAPGDLLLTGTPGDTLRASCEGLGTLTIRYQA